MKLTKILREKTETELNNARRAIDKQARAGYEERRKNAIAEIETLIENITPDIQAILAKYNMEIDNATEATLEASGHNRCWAIIGFHDGSVCNDAEQKALRDAENARYHKQKELIDEFALECELGVEKKDFLDALANLRKRVGE